MSGAGGGLCGSVAGCGGGNAADDGCGGGRLAALVGRTTAAVTVSAEGVNVNTPFCAVRVSSVRAF
jgi:hypothetical protein